MIKVYIADIRELGAGRPLESWLLLLPEAMAQNVMSYKKQEDRLRVLYGKLLLRYAMACEEPSLQLADVREEEKGRLYVAGSDFDFNISHSGNYTVLATTSNGPCGIDIEMHRNVDIESFRRLFTDGEWEAITGAEDPLRIFFTCWAIKESVIKADGRGVAVLSATEILSHQHTVCDGNNWYIHALEIADGYSASIAHHRPVENAPGIIRVTPSDLTADR